MLDAFRYGMTGLLTMYGFVALGVHSYYAASLWDCWQDRGWWPRLIPLYCIAIAQVTLFFFMAYLAWSWH